MKNILRIYANAVFAALGILAIIALLGALCYCAYLSGGVMLAIGVAVIESAFIAHIITREDDGGW